MCADCADAFNTCILCILTCNAIHLRWEVYATSSGHTEGIRDITLCSSITSTVKQDSNVNATKEQDDNSTSSSSSISSNSGTVIATCSNDGTVRWWSRVRTSIHYDCISKVACMM
jgi:hypothetical protein